jgi:hypothetical protein
MPPAASLFLTVRRRGRFMEWVLCLFARRRANAAPARRVSALRAYRLGPPLRGGLPYVRLLLKLFLPIDRFASGQEPSKR